MDELNRSVKLKLTRAHSQLLSLSESVARWTASDPANVVCDSHEGRLGFQLILRDFSEPAPLEQWGLDLGEFVHNLRSALDNLTYALARLRRDPPERPNRIQFPIFRDMTQFQDQGSRYIDQLPDEPAELIEKLQPFQRDGSPEFGTPDSDPLLLLHNLSNTDKHRVPPIVLINQTDISHGIIVEFYSEEDEKENVTPDTTVDASPIVPGSVLLDYKTTRPLKSIEVNYQIKAEIMIQISDNLYPITPTLISLHKHTDQVASQFEHFFQ